MNLYLAYFSVHKIVPGQFNTSVFAYFQFYHFPKSKINSESRFEMKMSIIAAANTSFISTHSTPVWVSLGMTVSHALQYLLPSALSPDFTELLESGFH